MFITQKEIQNFNSQINISPNIVFNVIQSLCTQSKNSTSIRINYLINENDEILFNNNKDENKDKYISFLFYEIFIIKIDFIKNKSKMIMIYNNENKEYKIKIWASKLEKLEIKNEYNKIIKKLCEKKTGNNILKNLLQLKPDKYTIYYFPTSVSLFEKELVFIYILILTQNEKSKFQNFKQIKDLISYSKSFLIPKINDLLLSKHNKKMKVYDKIAYIKTCNNIQNFKLLNFDDKENIIIDNFRKNINYVSPKNQEIQINFNSERFKKVLNKKYNSKKCIKGVNLLKKPYNKIVFNYSFEKTDNNNISNSYANTNNTTINKMKSYRESLDEQKKQINTIIINTSKTEKPNNYIKFSTNKIKKLNDESINSNSIQSFPFSIQQLNNSTIPYEKKRPSSIPRKIMHYLSTNNYSLQYKKKSIEKENEPIKTNNYCSFNNNNNNNINNIHINCKTKTKKILYKRKSFSKKKSQQSIDLNSNYFLQKLNSVNISDMNNSTDNIDTYTTANKKNIFNKENNCIILNKNRKNKNLIYKGSMVSINPLIKTYSFMKENNSEENINNNVNKIPVNKKPTLKISFRNSINQKLKSDIHLNGINFNNGNKTSRNIMNKKIRRELIFKQRNGIKNILNRTSENKIQKISDGEEEISLFL